MMRCVVCDDDVLLRSVGKTCADRQRLVRVVDGQARRRARQVAVARDEGLEGDIVVGPTLLG